MSNYRLQVQLYFEQIPEFRLILWTGNMGSPLKISFAAWISTWTVNLWNLEKLLLGIHQKGMKGWLNCAYTSFNWKQSSPFLYLSCMKLFNARRWHVSFILECQNELVDFCSINLRVMFSWIVINDSKPITLLLN